MVQTKPISTSPSIEAVWRAVCHSWLEVRWERVHQAAEQLRPSFESEISDRWVEGAAGQAHVVARDRAVTK